MKSYVRLCLTIAVNYFFWRGIYDNTHSQYVNKCDMTYMYEYPEYMEVEVSDNFIDYYKLYVYGEGIYAAQLSQKVYNGIPVLFIPGNQGSYKQVRSLASVAYRMSQKDPAFHFNYFAVDFNEEISALYGPVLDQQTLFVEMAIKSILKLYENNSKRPESVILIGHSIGGLIARAVVSLPDIQANLVSIIITLATPHARPVITSDSSLKLFSENINNYWTAERANKLENIVFVTVGGGRNDFQVPSWLTSSEFADIDETLLSVPLCWLTTDHLAIAWCKQLILAMNRALFNSVDRSTKQLSVERSHILKAFKNHISEKHIEAVDYNLLNQRINKMLKKNDWIEIKDLQFMKKLKYPKKQLFVIPLKSTLVQHHLTMILQDIGPDSFLIACSGNRINESLNISSGENLQQYLRIIPENKKELNLEYSYLLKNDFDYVIAYIATSTSNEDKTSIYVDISDPDSRHVFVQAPLFLTSFSPISVMKATPHNSLSINITIERFTEFWQSFVIRLTPMGECSPEYDKLIVSLRSSWVHRWEYVMNKVNNVHEFMIGVDIPSPVSGEGTVEIHIVKNPKCSYSVSLQKSLGGIFSRISLMFASQIPTYVLCHLLLILASLFKDLSKERKSFYFYATNISPVTVVPFMKLLSFGLARYTTIESDRAYLENARINIEILPLILFSATLPITLIISSVFKTLLIGISLIIHRCMPRFVHEESNEENQKEFSPRFFSISSLIAVFLLSLGLSTCGSLALSIASFVYFIKVLQMHINKLRRPPASSVSTEKENLISSEGDDAPPSTSEGDNALPSTSEQNTNSDKEKEISIQDSSIEIHFNLMLIVFALSLLNLPSLITWAKNLRYQQHLTSDPSLTTFSIMIIISLAVLWQIENFSPMKELYGVLGYVVHFSSVLVILFGTIQLFRVCEIASFPIMLIALYQLVSI